MSMKSVKTFATKRLHNFMMQYIILILVVTGYVYGIESTCERRCKSSFPLHTFPKKESFHACLRGCRLERIEQVSNHQGKLYVGPERNCERDCTTAYSGNTDSINACKIGCIAAQPALPTHEAMLQEEREKASFDDSFVILRPVFVIRRYCSGLYNVAVSYIGVSVVAEPNAQYSQASAVRVVEEDRVFRIQSVSEVSVRAQNGKKVALMKVEDKNVQKSSWLDCVSYKAGLPKWLLGSVLFVTVASVVYLCCSCACEEENEKLHSFDDVFTIPDDESTKMRLLLDLEQAPPLPPKYSEKGGIL